MLLDCFTIPCVMLLSFIFLKTRFRFIHYLGVALCLSGLALLVTTDAIYNNHQGNFRCSFLVPLPCRFRYLFLFLFSGSFFVVFRVNLSYQFSRSLSVFFLVPFFSLFVLYINVFEFRGRRYFEGRPIMPRGCLSLCHIQRGPRRNGEEIRSG